jgi:adenine-specific DNA methylase
LAKSLQFGLPFDIKGASPSIFRPVHYLGSKLRILDFIKSTIDDLDPSSGRVYDLFSGSGVVALKLSESRPVTAVDIQEYSRVLTSALLRPGYNLASCDTFIEGCDTSEFAKKIRWALGPIAEFEEQSLKSAIAGDPEQLSDLIEQGSIIAYEKDRAGRNISPVVEKQLLTTLDRLRTTDLINNSNALVSRLAGGIYFSFKQAVDFDIILQKIKHLDASTRDNFMAPLLSAMSNCVNTVGKQFAQPIQPKTTDGRVKPNLGLRVQKDRSLKVFDEFKKSFDKYSQLKPGSFENHSVRMDFNTALDSISDDTKVIYADPPYTRDHYSRYYHFLETVSLGEIPEISTNKVAGKTEISRGLYRVDRHQSPFCIKSQAPDAFRSMIRKSRERELALVISYSPFDHTKKTHPRLLTMQQLTGLAGEYYKNVDVISPGTFVHSKLNSSDKHLEASEAAEVLVVCQ